jgi:hypothetical protein
MRSLVLLVASALLLSSSSSSSSPPSPHPASDEGPLIPNILHFAGEEGNEMPYWMYLNALVSVTVQRPEKVQ